MGGRSVEVEEGTVRVLLRGFANPTAAARDEELGGGRGGDDGWKGRGGEGREGTGTRPLPKAKRPGPGRSRGTDSTRLARTHQPGSRHSGRSVPHLSGRAGAGSGCGVGSVAIRE